MTMTPTAQWMADPAVQARRVGQLVLPGTHDSGTFSLTLQLSQIKYPDIQFLWDLRPGQAPPGFPGGAPFYLGRELYDFTFQFVREISQAHDRDIARQLADGIRYFDLRVYWDTDDSDLYIHHGLRGAPLSQLLADVGQFVGQAGGRELVFLEVSHTNFDEQAGGPAALAAQLEKYVGASNLYVPESLDALAAETLSSITGAGSRVVVINTGGDTYPAGSPVLTTPGFQDSGRAASGVDDVNALERLEARGLAQKRTGPFYKIAWTLTPQAADVIDGAVARLNDSPSPPVLKSLAGQANAALRNFVEAHGQYSFNLINVDWYEGSPVVELAIELSRGAAPV